MNRQAEEIKQWIIKGDHDLGTAQITYLYIPEYLDTVTFHCQQAVEKYMKAYLIFLNTPFKFTHDLVYLLDLISENDPHFDAYYDLLSELQGYAVEVRYPNDTIYLSKEKVEKAIQIAREIRELVTLKANLSIDYNEVINK
jgi:HEPN domain-containing protein